MTKEETYQHLLDRKMRPELYTLGIDAGVVVFPLRQFNGRQVGYQNYRPFAERNCKNVQEARYFTYLPKGVDGYFGLESLTMLGTVYLVEGVFKAGTLHRLGYPAIALMGSETKRHVEQLFLLRRRQVAIGDNDEAGHKFARSLGGLVSPRDLDEMSDEEIKELLSENS
jgi:DNA primase